MPKNNDKAPVSRSDYEAIGADILNAHIREQMKAGVAAVRGRAAITIAGDELAHRADMARDPLQHARAWRDKAEEARTIAGTCQCQDARQTYLRLADAYEKLADRAAARADAVVA
jgi:hypothetical protein